jgi:hypothetical protein
LNDEVIVRYDFRYVAGYQEKRYKLQTTAVVGHTPTDAEKAGAKVSYFSVNKTAT